MGMDMIGMMLKGLGVDPAAVLGQAAQLGAAFEAIGRSQAAMTEQLAAIAGNQLAVMAHLGIPIPMPTGDVAALIADESRRHIESLELSGPIVAADAA